MGQGLDRPRDSVVKFGAPKPQQFKPKPFKPKQLETQQFCIVEQRSTNAGKKPLKSMT
jgi:hypothetical protein